MVEEGDCITDSIQRSHRIHFEIVLEMNVNTVADDHRSSATVLTFISNTTRFFFVCSSFRPQKSHTICMLSVMTATVHSSTALAGTDLIKQGENPL
jgi:hypothetical protein